VAEPAARCAVYPVIFLDAIHVKIRDGQVANRPVYVALAVTAEGTRDILGLWAGDGGEGAKYWLHVLTELKNRGVGDVCMVVCDGLSGLALAENVIRPGQRPGSGLTGSQGVMALADRVGVVAREAVAAG
jgi:transposase-like protein